MSEKRIRYQSKDSLGKYLQDINRIPLLSYHEEMKLAKKIQRGDQQALARLVNANLKFVVFIAREYQDRGLPLDELISEGNLGLIEAARRYDGSRGIKFISYAVWWIRQAILRALANHSRLVRLPVNHIWAYNRIGHVIEELEQELGRAPELHEVARQLDISTTQLSKQLSMWRHAIPLEDSTRPDEESLDLIDKIGSEEFDGPMADLLNESRKRDIEAALASLPPVEADVLRLYFGIERERPMTLLEIGNTMKLSRERIRQIKNKALKKLRHLQRREMLRPYLG
ncbi:MAG: RNA polymerase sigma factor RpoD/SigA [candidate division KSB1 bacterium]|nr:RNA polymerase sigma factor RpoD/SigA [candidate division KSB1 bacterium]MDZ7334286.1 RNA polymerase sigma factor RpoD/SigA [candidate division KSB1 bacterium]MDZ7356496.1 RNA polymerase sigma factor RpoD/SigA [candidate division KSB1 bacterium]MDZ7400503.1 RNA polymerase sigma factor RpoD/SigA [candidate division KSB1 bacterium]